MLGVTKPGFSASTHFKWNEGFILVKRTLVSLRKRRWWYHNPDLILDF